MVAVQEQPQQWVPTDSFGARLALVRQAMRWNVKTAAAECGINHQSWANWEKDKPCTHMPAVARKIADRTGVDVRWLLAGGELPTRWWSGSPGLELVPGAGAQPIGFVKQLAFFPHALRATDHAP